METTNKALLTILAIIIIAISAYSIKNTLTDTFKTNPSILIDIRSNTEYYNGDSGKILALLTNKDGEPISATCYASITYPNQSYFIQNAATTPTTLGSYQLTFTAPDTEGVYEYTANCTIGTKTFYQGKSFHISNATNIILNTLSTNKNEVDQLLQNISTQITDSNTSIIQAQTNTNNLITSTNQSLNTFSNLTSENFQTIIELLQNFSNNQSIGNLSSSIEDLKNIVLQFQNDNAANFSQVINLLNAANQSINTNIDMTKQLIQQANNSINTRIDTLELTLTQQETDETNILLAINQSITQAINNINITLTNTSLNIYITTNDCLQGGTWLIQSTVTNQFGVPLSSPPINCQVTTNTWGTSSMTYNGALKLFQYTHTCDLQGNIAWTVDCS